MKAVTAAALLVLSTVGANAAGWSCSAPGLVSGSYEGGDTAYIHLEGFPNGNSYSVTKSGKRATGKTSNGTKFVCTPK